MDARDRRAVLLGGALVIAAWGVTRAWPAARATVSVLEAETEQLAVLVDRGRRETLSLEPLADSIARMEGLARRLGSILLIGTDETTAAFDLTRRLTLVVSRTPSFVSGVRPALDSVRSGPLRRASVEAELETDVVGLLSIVRDIETDSSLALERVEVGAHTPDAPRSQVERLYVRLRVTGWFRSEVGDSVGAGGRKP